MYLKNKKVISKSAAQTKKIAAELARDVLSKKETTDKAIVIGLIGDLGAGKTTFIQGFLRELGVKSKITSPSFVIMKTYKLKTGQFKKAYHIDCYRLRSKKDLTDLGIKEILKDSGNVILMEWPNVIKYPVDKQWILIKFRYGAKENDRELRIIGV